MPDVIIIGAGPAGIFAAMTLLDQGISDLLLLERGSDLSKRRCPARENNGHCLHCSPCSILTGWGGAGAFSDGKLTLTTEVGGFLGELVPRSELEELIRTADKRFVDYGAPAKIYGGSSRETRRIKALAKKAEMTFVEMEVRHLGTENCYLVLKRIRSDLNGRLEIRTQTQVKSIRVQDGMVKGVETEEGEFIPAKFVVSAPGRVGSDWMRGESRRLGLAAIPSPVDIGLRVELPAAVLEELTSATYESKLIYYSKTFDDKVRTFCMNPYGKVVTEYTGDIMTVNGHSYAEKKTENTNFALLVSTIFTEPFDDPIAYGRYISRLANLLGKGVIVQRLGDLLNGRRSTPERIAHSSVRPTLESATPGDLSFVLPYRYIKDITEMLEAMDQIAPGVNSRHTLLYGVEVKFYSHRIEVDRNMETKIRNLFVVGDGAGITRGLIQASASGILAGQAISRKTSKKTRKSPAKKDKGGRHVIPRLLIK
ncbi:MAG: FAD-dependent oxidoreductase [Nitrospirae bacterium CG2_30_53_67]|nr:MAG: FAD-dependent oxidoreductase [Nitrospirae bacterium CG2_30_53_67]